MGDLIGFWEISVGSGRFLMAAVREESGTEGCAREKRV